MTPSTPATNYQGGRTLNAETTGTTPNTVLFQDASTTPSQPFSKSFSLDLTQVKEALGCVKSHLSDNGIWKIIESQPAPIRDIIIWFCDQMNLAHLRNKQRERALKKYTDVKDGDFGRLNVLRGAESPAFDSIVEMYLPHVSSKINLWRTNRLLFQGKVLSKLIP
jgi:hypothetical protein